MIELENQNGHHHWETLWKRSLTALPPAKGPESKQHPYWKGDELEQQHEFHLSSHLQIY
jgi:hypothetical protein